MCYACGEDNREAIGLTGDSVRALCRGIVAEAGGSGLKMFTRSLVVAVATAFCATLYSGTSSAQSLGDELRGLLANHPEVRSRTNALESANKAVDEAFAGFLPSLDLSADMGPENIDSPARRTAQRTRDRDWRRTRNVATVTATQNLFDGFATSAELDQAQLNARVARFTLEGTRQNTIFDGIDAYLNVLRQKRLIELARSNERTIMRQLNLEDERVQRGAGIAVDVLESKRRLQLAKERRVNFEGALEDAISQYIQVFDHAPDMDAMVDPVPPVELLPASQVQAVEIASSENPAVSSSRLTVEVAHQLRRAARSDFFPTFDVVGTVNYEKHRDAVLGTRREWSVLLQATWNLFNGFATDASVSQAAFNYRASQDNHEFVTRNVIEATRRAWQQLVTARERVDLLENAVNIASEVFEARKRLREEGKETVINVLDAENGIIDAQIQFTQVSYDQRLAVYQLL